VDELIADLSLVEKAGQLTQYFYLGSPTQRRWRCAVGGEVERRWRVRGGVAAVRDRPARPTRLKADSRGKPAWHPGAVRFDVIHGLRTVFPVPIAMAASWDPETIERGQAVAAREARAVGIHWTFAPMVDVARDLEWGRMSREQAKTPYLGAAVAAAQVRGFQVTSWEPLSASSRTKHFAG
jgi:beta-glucosidase